MLSGPTKFFFGFLGCSLLLLSGCAGYRLGPTNGLAAGDKSVQYVPFVNRTIERVKESDYLDALRVDPAATPEEVDAAFNNIVSALHLENMPAGMPCWTVARQFANGSGRRWLSEIDTRGNCGQRR